jgi:hypothetical protein
MSSKNFNLFSKAKGKSGKTPQREDLDQMEELQGLSLQEKEVPQKQKPSRNRDFSPEDISFLLKDVYGKRSPEEVFQKRLQKFLIEMLSSEEDQ